MKSNALHAKCLSAIACVVRGGTTGAPERAHTPLRRRTAPARAKAAPIAHADAEPTIVQRAVDSDGPRVLHVDTQTGTAAVLASLLGGAVHVTHVATLAQARRLLQEQIFSLVILDPALPDGDASQLLPLLAGTPLLVYSDQQLASRDAVASLFLPKSVTTARQLWTAMSSMLWDTSALSAGD